ncbi:hypothetical protein AB0L75_00815 [Streptomyces sp. NPDC052101]|uniref:hypothetical protein n=1 Tax=Streptomyces sp. NPDC052101 TaxID=3155763 RepID=UPI003418F926
MNEIIPPSDDRKRDRLERKADALLEAAGDHVADGWPGSWPRQEETEFDRIAAAHAGMVPLAAVSLIASLPSFAPEEGGHAIRDLMQERPGVGEPDPLSEILEATADATPYGSGFALERRNFPPDECRWDGCDESLYAAGKTRKPGRPGKYCALHKKAAKARTRRRRYAGVRVGKNRNLLYGFNGLKDQDLSGYRQIWGTVNTARL